MSIMTKCVQVLVPIEADVRRLGVAESQIANLIAQMEMVKSQLATAMGMGADTNHGMLLCSRA
jgi:hypothetical protein